MAENESPHPTHSPGLRMHTSSRKRKKSSSIVGYLHSPHQIGSISRVPNIRSHCIFRLLAKPTTMNLVLPNRQLQSYSTLRSMLRPVASFLCTTISIAPGLALQRSRRRFAAAATAAGAGCREARKRRDGYCLFHAF